MTMTSSLLPSSGDPRGEHRGHNGEAVRAGVCDVLHNVPETGLQRGIPPTLSLALLRTAA